MRRHDAYPPMNRRAIVGRPCGTFFPFGSSRPGTYVAGLFSFVPAVLHELPKIAPETFGVQSPQPKGWGTRRRSREMILDALQRLRRVREANVRNADDSVSRTRLAAQRESLRSP